MMVWIASAEYMWLAATYSFCKAATWKRSPPRSYLGGRLHHPLISRMEVVSKAVGTRQISEI